MFKFSVERMETNLLKIADVAVSSSKREGIPVNIMEAMATGIPTIVNDCRGNRDLVSNGDNGYVIGVNDVVGFADAIETLYNSKELRSKFGQRNIQISKLFSIQNNLKEIKKIYDGLNKQNVE